MEPLTSYLSGNLTERRGLIMKIQPLRFIRLKFNSLFLQLVAGFLCIILLLASLTSYALSVSKNDLRQEVVKYNTLMLHNMMENYEKHFEIIKKQMYLFYNSEVVQRLQREPQYSSYPAVIKDIQSWVSNPYLFIDNIVIYSKQHHFVIEKGTSTSPEIMFDVFYASDRYPVDFWDRQFEEDYTNRTFPADTFYNNLFSNRQVVLGEQIPIIFKIQNNEEFIMAVFLDARKMYEKFHQTINNDFIMYNEKGETIFKPSDSDSFIPLNDLKTYDGNEFILDDKYHFYTKGTGSGMTYIHRLPVAQIASQTQLNLTMLVMIAAVILLAILLSFLFAARINNPLKKLIDSIRGTSEAEPFRSNIQEFDLINSQLSDKKKMLKQWAFINYLKDIRNQDNDSVKLDFSDKAFVFVLFQVIEKKNATKVHNTFQSWLYYIKVFIEVKLNAKFPDALTIQVEYNQILCLVFIEDLEELRDLLHEMKSVFDQDLESGTITIAVTSKFNHFNQVPEAYKEVHERFGDRMLIDVTQIVDSPANDLNDFSLTQEQEKEFQANLKEGNVKALTLLLERFIAKWRDQDITAAAWMRFAEGITARIRHAASFDLLGQTRLDDILDNSHEKIQQCVTIGELELLLLDWVKQITEAILEKMGRKDAITSFVIDYINDNLADEIYLDTVAEKLNISSGYLSTYFKEKTGINMVEYINEARIRKATVLLVESQLKIQNVAEAVGYRNITSFNRMFKKYTGLKPSEYRKNRDTPYEDIT